MVKQRMTALDVRAAVEEMRSKIVGLRLLNLYDLNNKMFLFRFGHGENKRAILLENGVRFHLTEYAREKPKVPSQFTLKIRKHIRSWRLDSIQQLQNDRSIDLCFGVAGSESCFHIIIELFSKGNIILTDHTYTIMMLLRTHRDDDVKIAVHQIYPAVPPHAAESGEERISLCEWGVSAETGLLEMHRIKPDRGVGRDEEKISAEVARRGSILREEWLAVYARNQEDETLKSTLSGVRHFGPAVAEHILTLAHLRPNLKKKENSETPEAIFEKLLPFMLTAWDMTHMQLPSGGYLLKGTNAGRERRGKKNSETAEEPTQPAPVKIEMTSSDAAGQRSETKAPETVQYDDFAPLLLAQYHTSAIEVHFLPSFGDVCDAFFLPTEAQKVEQNNEKKKNTALSKREKFERDHLRRVTALEHQQELNQKIGEAIIANADRVDEAIELISGALATGIQWDSLKALVKQRHDEGHPVAYLIHDLHLEKKSITLLLTQDLYDDEDDCDVPPLVVEVSLMKSALGNAADYFAKKKFSKAKLIKTEAAKEKAAAGAARKGDRQAAKQKTAKEVVVERSKSWWEKFNWFRTSAGDVGLQGKDHQTTEILIRRLMLPGDFFVHCDVSGALPCLLRPMNSVWSSSPEKKADAKVSYRSLREVGGWCVSRSSAWQSKQTTSAWWVRGSQITGGTATGSYLYEGEKQFLPPQPLSLGFGLLFSVDRDIRQNDSEIEEGETKDEGLLGELNGLQPSLEAPVACDDILIDYDAALHPLPTVEELRAMQRANQAPVGAIRGVKRPFTAPTAKEGGKHKPEEPGKAEKKPEYIDRSSSEIIKGNLTKKQSKKLQKIRKKYGDQDDEDRQLGALLNGNAPSQVEVLLSDSSTGAVGAKNIPTQPRQVLDLSPPTVNETSSQTTADQVVTRDGTQREGVVDAKKKEADLQTRLPPAESREVFSAQKNEELLSALPYYTCKPRPSDIVRHVVGFTCPFATAASYPFRVELIHGMSKKGQVAHALLDHFKFVALKKNEFEGSNLLKALEAVDITDVVEQLRSDVKTRIS